MNRTQASTLIFAAAACGLMACTFDAPDVEPEEARLGSSRQELISPAVDKLLPKSILTLADMGSDAVKAYSFGMGAYEGAMKALLFIGALEAGPDSQTLLFEELKQKIEELGVGLDWRLNQTDRQNRFSDMRASLFQAKEALDAGTTYPKWGTGDFQSLQAVLNAEEHGALNTSFLRAFQSSIHGGTFFTGSPLYAPHPNNNTYDWRVGLPDLIHLIAMRLIIISAMDPDWQTNGNYNDELLHHRRALLVHYQKMKEGITCGGRNNFPDEYGPGYSMDVGVHVVCADLHTGLTASAAQTTGIEVPACMNCAHTDWCSECLRQEYGNVGGTVADAIIPQVKAELEDHMPFREVKDVANSLREYVEYAEYGEYQ